MSWRSEAHRPEHADEQNERMAALVQRDADEQERVDSALDARYRDSPLILAAAAWASRPTPVGSSPPLRSSNPEQGGRDAR